MHKFRFIIIGVVFLAWHDIAQAANSNTPDHIGAISQQELLSNYQHFAENFERHMPSQEDIELIKKLEGKQVLILFGTWCHDSVREIPRLLKLLDRSEVALEDVTLYGIDRRKSDPEGFAKKHGLKYTPTIIVFGEHDKEVARIIERPNTSLAGDLANQLNQNL